MSDTPEKKVSLEGRVLETRPTPKWQKKFTSINYKWLEGKVEGEAGLIVQVTESGYEPLYIRVVARISEYLFTARIEKPEDAEKLGNDPRVHSVAFGERLYPCKKE